jgi:hypothetical protein
MSRPNAFVRDCALWCWASTAALLLLMVWMNVVAIVVIAVPIFFVVGMAMMR